MCGARGRDKHTLFTKVSSITKVDIVLSGIRQIFPKVSTVWNKRNVQYYAYSSSSISGVFYVKTQKKFLFSI